MKLSCSQISSLLNFYVNNKLQNPIKELVEAHLENCNSCSEKYKAILSINLQFVQAKEYLDNIGKINYSTDFSSVNDDYDFAAVQSLSAYSDNELSDEESLKIKKYIVKNLSARKSLEELYELRNILKKSFEKEEAMLKSDFSKSILNKLELEDEIKRGGSKLKVASVLIFLLTSFTVGVIYLLTNLLV